ncbi:hypothetical protein GCM10023320_08010 [Pseudonocardia adelaidensis]|uniref:Uncharacterized protein n=1 Tax=Pseudonocardia adelaidensis TaxID=648754 RepID=A0ABP9NDN4_9PSEU
MSSAASPVVSDRWVRAWCRGGFDVLVPTPRQAELRVPVEVIEMAIAAERENPAGVGTRSGASCAKLGWAPGERDGPRVAVRPGS